MRQCLELFRFVCNVFDSLRRFSKIYNLETKLRDESKRVLSAIEIELQIEPFHIDHSICK